MDEDRSIVTRTQGIAARRADTDPNRPMFEGILWMLRAGALWKDLLERFPSPNT
jgi:transposase